MFGGSAPQQVIQLPADSKAVDTPATVDPNGLQNWMTAGLAATDTKKQQADGFNLGQQVALGTGSASKRSLFTKPQPMFA